MAAREPKIDNTTIGLMVTTAILFDGGSAVPWIGMIFSFLGYCTFFLWFYMKGLGVFRPKKLVVWALSVAAEFGFSAVGLGAIPALTAGVVVNIFISRVEDFTGIKLPTNPADAVKLAQQVKQMPGKVLPFKQQGTTNNNEQEGREQMRDVVPPQKNVRHPVASKAA